MAGTAKNGFQRFFDRFKDFNRSRKLMFKELKCENIKEKPKIDQPSCPDISVFGTSICGDDTALQVECGLLGLDAGPSVSKMPLPDHLFISHDHDDHIRGLPDVACMTMREQKDIDVYIGNKINDNTKAWIQKIHDINPENHMHVHFVNHGDHVQLDGENELEFFDTNHSPGSMGVSLIRKKGHVKENYITYTGDINLADNKMREDRHLHDARHLITEASYFGFPLTDPMYMAWSHSSFDDVKRLLDERKIPPDSVTFMHIPYAKSLMVPCPMIEWNINDSRANDVGYVPTCLSGLKNPLKPANRNVLD